MFLLHTELHLTFIQFFTIFYSFLCQTNTHKAKQNLDTIIICVLTAAKYTKSHFLIVSLDQKNLYKKLGSP